MSDLLPGVTSYELGRIREHVADHARQFPTGIWAQAYRAASTRHLVAIPGRQGPWSDPTFVAKYDAIRAAIVAASPSGEVQTIAEAVQALGTLLERKQLLESAF
jgi:hypothetical protein